MVWAMNRARKLRREHMPLAAPEETFRSSGTTNLMHRTWTSRQEGKSWAGMVKVFRPREYSWPLSSTSVRMAARATRLPGQTFLRVTFSWMIRPWDSRYTSPAFTTTASAQPSTDRSTGSGQPSGQTTTSQDTVTVGSGKVTAFPSASE